MGAFFIILVLLLIVVIAAIAAFTGSGKGSGQEMKSEKKKEVRDHTTYSDGLREEGTAVRQSGRRGEDAPLKEQASAGQAVQSRVSGSAGTQSSVLAEKTLQTNTEEMQAQREEQERKDGMLRAKKALYQYLNRSFKQMFRSYHAGQWESLKQLYAPETEILTYYEQILEELPKRSGQIVEEFFSCVRREASGDAAEEPAGTVTDSERLQKLFFSLLLPFYPEYERELEGVRYTAFFAQEALELFKNLTGKRYRLGYKNRYSNGQAAFTWKGDRYQVYDAQGELLCDAVFADGKIREGYAVTRLDDGDWEEYRTMRYEDGQGTEEKRRYVYKKACQ